MDKDLIIWLGKKLNDLIPKEGRQRFLNDLKNNQEYVVKIFAHDLDNLFMQYMLETKNGELIVSAVEGDPNVYVTYAKAVVAHMRDELLKSELESV